MITRRQLIIGAGAVPAITLLDRRTHATDALKESSVVYITPLKSNGQESRCKAEVWFAYDGQDICIVTAADAWRAEAVRQGLTTTRMWVGEYGVWTGSNDGFRQAPELMAAASLETNADEHTRVLDIMGDKYTLEWFVWGPRFKNGLADGSRVMIRYTVEG